MESDYVRSAGISLIPGCFSYPTKYTGGGGQAIFGGGFFLSPHRHIIIGGVGVETRLYRYVAVGFDACTVCYPRCVNRSTSTLNSVARNMRTELVVVVN